MEPSKSSNTQDDTVTSIESIPTSDVSIKQEPSDHNDDMNVVDEPKVPLKKPEKKMEKMKKEKKEKKKSVNPLDEGVDVVDGQDGSYMKFALQRLPMHRKLTNPLSKQSLPPGRDVKTYYLSSFFVSCTFKRTVSVVFSLFVLNEFLFFSFLFFQPPLEKWSLSTWRKT